MYLQSHDGVEAELSNPTMVWATAALASTTGLEDSASEFTIGTLGAQAYTLAAEIYELKQQKTDLIEQCWPSATT